jgi:hypothetical protein
VQPEPLIPEFEATVAATLEFLGVPGIFIVLLLTLLAVEGWLSNVKRAVVGAKTVGKLAGRGGVWLFKQHPARLVITVATTVLVLVVQGFMVRLSYTGGSLIAAPFDAVRRVQVEVAMETSPTLLADPAYLVRLVKLDLVSAIYIVYSVAVIVYSYRAKSHALTMTAFLAAPFWLFLLGMAAIAVFVVGLNVVFTLIRLITGGSADWTMTQEIVLTNANMGITLISGIYSATALAAVVGARLVHRVWTIREDSV